MKDSERNGITELTRVPEKEGDKNGEEAIPAVTRQTSQKEFTLKRPIDFCSQTRCRNRDNIYTLILNN